jgi:hypothetical protein
VQDALERADRSRLRGRAWSLTARLPRDSSCPRVARGLLEEYAREELGRRWDRARVGGAVCRPALRRPHTGTTGGGGFG